MYNTDHGYHKTVSAIQAKWKVQFDWQYMGPPHSAEFVIWRGTDMCSGCMRRCSALESQKSWKGLNCSSATITTTATGRIVNHAPAPYRQNWLRDMMLDKHHIYGRYRVRQKDWQSCRSGCLIHNGTYLTLSLTLTIMLTLLTLTLLTLLTLILYTIMNKAPTSAG